MMLALHNKHQIVNKPYYIKIMLKNYNICLKMGRSVHFCLLSEIFILFL